MSAIGQQTMSSSTQSRNVNTMHTYDIRTRAGSVARRAAVLAALVATSLVGPAGSSAQAQAPAAAKAGAAVANPDPARFVAEIRAFRAWDEKNAVPRDGVLFVGSSSIRLWSTGTAFPGVPVINRGFGGAHISDVNYYLSDVAQMYGPAVVVFYGGDNDIGAGKGRDQVLADYNTFVSRMLTSRRNTQVVLIAIKPSLQRWAQWPLMREVNEALKTFSATDERLHFADIATPMLGADGKPRPEMFVADGLHMTPAGYAAWNKVLGPMLEKIRSGK